MKEHEVATPSTHHLTNANRSSSTTTNIRDKFSSSFNSFCIVFQQQQPHFPQSRSTRAIKSSINRFNRDNTMTGFDTLQFVRVVPHNHTTTTTGEIGKAIKLHYKWKPKKLYFLFANWACQTNKSLRTVLSWLSIDSRGSAPNQVLQGSTEKYGRFRDDWILHVTS